MKKTFGFLVIISIVAVIGFSMIACGDGSDSSIVMTGYFDSPGFYSFNFENDSDFAVTISINKIKDTIPSGEERTYILTVATATVTYSPADLVTYSLSQGEVYFENKYDDALSTPIPGSNKYTFNNTTNYTLSISGWYISHNDPADIEFNLVAKEKRTIYTPNELAFIGYSDNGANAEIKMERNNNTIRFYR